MGVATGDPIISFCTWLGCVVPADSKVYGCQSYLVGLGQNGPQRGGSNAYLSSKLGYFQVGQYQILCLIKFVFQIDRALFWYSWVVLSMKWSVDGLDWQTNDTYVQNVNSIV